MTQEQVQAITAGLPSNWRIGEPTNREQSWTGPRGYSIYVHYEVVDPTTEAPVKPSAVVKEVFIIGPIQRTGLDALLESLGYPEVFWF
jgi:hypothetical protein